MPSITSYFNPLSNQHFEVNNFKQLEKTSDKFFIIVLTTFATLISLPIAGLGGVAVFRALTKLKQENETVQKIQNVYLQTMSEFYKQKGLKVIETDNDQSFETEKDTFFHIASQKLNMSENKLIAAMKEFINKNKITVKSIFYLLDADLANSTNQFDPFFHYLVSDNLFKTLNTKYNKEECVKIQNFINNARANILSQMYDVKVLIHNITMKQVADQNGVPVELNPSIATGEKKLAYGTGANVIEIVQGSIVKVEMDSVAMKMHKTFIQPRIINKA